MADYPIYIEESRESLDLQIMFSSSSVTLAREEYAFSFLSLLADVGGVLGIFIGFNFLQLCILASVLIKMKILWIMIKNISWNKGYQHVVFPRILCILSNLKIFFIFWLLIASHQCFVIAPSQPLWRWMTHGGTEELCKLSASNLSLSLSHTQSLSSLWLPVSSRKIKFVKYNFHI